MSLTTEAFKAEEKPPPTSKTRRLAQRWGDSTDLRFNSDRALSPHGKFRFGRHTVLLSTTLRCWKVEGLMPRLSVCERHDVYLLVWELRRTGSCCAARLTVVSRASRVQAGHHGGAQQKPTFRSPTLTVTRSTRAVRDAWAFLASSRARRCLSHCGAFSLVVARPYCSESTMENACSRTWGASAGGALWSRHTRGWAAKRN